MPNLFDRIRLWFNFRKYQYSELGSLGDLTQMSFDELCAKLKHMHIEIISRDARAFRAKFEDQFTLYILHFDSEGQFVSIEEESWKHFGA
jgi:hypothetical protein